MEILATVQRKGKWRDRVEREGLKDSDKKQVTEKIGASVAPHERA